MDLQPSSLLSPVSVCNRLELHDLLDHPYRSRGMSHSVACLEDTGDHEPSILPHGQPPAPIPQEPSDRSRTTRAHSLWPKCFCDYESLHRRERVSLCDNESDSRLLWAWIRRRVCCLRPDIGRSQLSVLGRALFHRSDPCRLAPHPGRIARFHGTASPKSHQQEMTDQLGASKKLIF